MNTAVASRSHIGGLHRLQVYPRYYSSVYQLQRVVLCVCALGFVTRLAGFYLRRRHDGRSTTTKWRHEQYRSSVHFNAGLKPPVGVHGSRSLLVSITIR